MSSEIDILIVFADADNVPSEVDEVLWVSQFKKFLEFALSQVIDEKLNIMLKSQHDSLTSPRLDNVGILIPILSRNFVSSSTCVRYVETFYKTINQDFNRIFKVAKSPIPLLEQPVLLRTLLEYDMYQLDPDSGELREYTDYFNNEAEKQYWMHLVDLSYDLAGALNRLKNQNTESSVKHLQQKKIYVAETAQELSIERGIIIRELQRHGYTVLPNQTLPPDFFDMEALVKKDMLACSMSIHLIGNTYGTVPEGSTRSIVEIQHKIAADRSEAARKDNETFARLIWIAPNLTHLTERQNRFIETIRRDVEGQDAAELLETPLEDFKNILREELLTVGDRKHVRDTGGRAIYLLHDKQDVGQIDSFKNLIEQSGFRLLMPDTEGELLMQRQKHLENLRAFDGVLIYKGNADEQWVRMKALDIVKAPGYGRKKPIVAKAIMCATGDITQREIFQHQNFRIIEGDGDYFLESLKTFLMEFTAES